MTPAPPTDLFTEQLMDAAEEHATAYDDDDRDCIKTDVMNAFYAGAAWHAAQSAAPADGLIYESVSRRADPAAHDAALAESLAVLDGGGDLVRLRLAEAGLTDKGMLDAVLGTFARLRDENLALHRRLAGETLRADLGWGRAASKSQECIDLRERTANSPEFEGIGKSVTVTEKGPWMVNDWGQGRFVIQSQDFTHDVALEISGDFGSLELERAHAEEIARRLNTVTGEFYTCIGKGGNYELLGIARGAGTSRDLVELVVYRSVESGAVFYRSVQDFADRMQKIGGDQ